MLLRRVTDFVLQGRVQAMAAVFVITFVPLLGIISILIAALVTLRKGAFEGALVTTAATIPYLISFYGTALPESQIQPAMYLLDVIILSNVLTWLLAVILRRFNSWSLTLEVTAVFGIVMIGALWALYPSMQEWWTSLIATLDKLNSTIQVKKVNISSIAFIKFSAITVLFNSILQLLAARWWQVAMFNPGGLRKELCQIRLGYVTGVFFVLTIVVAGLGNDLAFDFAVIVGLIYFAAGLSLLHDFFNTKQIGWSWCIVIYAAIILALPLAIIVIPLMGLLDTAIDLRKRFNLMRGDYKWK